MKLLKTMLESIDAMLKGVIGCELAKASGDILTLVRIANTYSESHGS